MPEKTKPNVGSPDREQLRRELLRLILKNEEKRKAQIRSANA